MSPKPIWLVTRDIAAMKGLISCRGQPIPHFTAGSIEPSHVLGNAGAIAEEYEIEQPALGDLSNLLIHPNIGKVHVAPRAGTAPATVQMNPRQIVAEMYFLFHARSLKCHRWDIAGGSSRSVLDPGCAGFHRRDRQDTG